VGFRGYQDQEVRNVRRYDDLKEFVDPAIDEVVNGSGDIVREELANEENRYELQLSKEGEDTQTRLVLDVKDNGRPVPLVTVNAVSDLGENLFYRSQPIDRSRKLILNVKEALRDMVDRLSSSQRVHS
jgi:hypothetical protein